MSFTVIAGVMAFMAATNDGLLRNVSPGSIALAVAASPSVRQVPHAVVTTPVVPASGSRPSRDAFTPSLRSATLRVARMPDDPMGDEPIGDEPIGEEPIGAGPRRPPTSMPLPVAVG